MKFEIRYANGAPHEVEIEGTVAVLGRDPSCDLVLTDVKCSRRHAVLEAGPQGVSIRDAGSANGTYLNGKKIERATLKEGDVVKLGDVQLTVLAEEIPGTVVMGPDDMPEIASDVDLEPVSAAPAAEPPRFAPTPPPAPRPPVPSVPPLTARTVPSAPPVRPPAVPPPAPQPIRPTVPAPRPAPAERPRPPRPAPVRAEPIPRPLTVTVIGLLWALAALVYAGGGLGYTALSGLRGAPLILTLLATFFLTILSGVMAFGLLSLSRWARVLQIAVAIPGLLICPFTIGIASILAYMFRPEAKIYFSGRGSMGDLTEEEAALVRKGAPEGLFAAAVLGGFFLGVVISVVGGVVGWNFLRPTP